MLELPSRIDKKILILAPIGLGFYLALLYLFHALILEIFYYRFGIAVYNNYPLLTLFLLFIFSAPLAIGLSSLLSKTKLTYDSALLSGLVANYSFGFTIAFAVFLLENSGRSVFVFIGTLFFSFTFGFVVSALMAMLVDRINSANLKLRQ